MWEVKVGMYFLGGFGGTIGKYLRAKQSFDSDTNFVQKDMIHMKWDVA